MSFREIISTFPGDARYPLFETTVKVLYPEDSPRFRSGNDPAKQWLEGCFVLLKDGEPKGRFAWYENPQLILDGKTIGMIGSYECSDDPDDAKFLLDHAVSLSRNRKHAFIVGPMEGSTWNNYRFTESGEAPPFFMEPYHHAYYAEQFRTFGFTPLAHYVSRLDVGLNTDLTELENLEKSLLAQGANIRHPDLSHADEEFLRLAHFNNEAFQDNFLFSPIPPKEFVGKYVPYVSYFDPELIIIVENQKGEIEALSFSLPDHFDPEKKTFIVKTLVRKKDSPFRGIGRYLSMKTYAIARKKGYQRAIHAFMIRENHSVGISGDFAGEDFKHHTLFKYEL